VRAGIAQLQRGVEVEVQMNGATATIESEEEVQEDNEAEVEGLLASISGSTLVVGSTTVQVSSTTTIRASGDQTLQLSDLRVGERVEVKGVLQGTAVNATEIDLKDEPPASVPDNNETELKGVVSSLVAGTSCTATARAPAWPPGSMSRSRAARQAVPSRRRK
jgi:hypothetical protein